MRWRQRQRRVAALLALVVVAGLILAPRGASAVAAAFAARHGTATPARDTAADATSTDSAIAPMPFEQAGASFPGSAFYYLAADVAQSDSPPDPGLAEAAGPAARALAITAPRDHARALACLTAAIYYEAAREPDDGQRAVAQVVLNRLAHPAFPKTVCGVVFQGSERASGCQFTFACDGALLRTPDRAFWARAEAAARAALAGYVYAPIGLATHYHTFAVHPLWENSLAFIGQIGAHRFYRLEGPAGTPAVFRFAYAGGEPLPGPHPRSYDASPEATPDPVAIEHAYAANPPANHAVAVVTTAYPAPAYSADMLRRGGDAAFRLNTPGGASGEARPEFRDSGRWLDTPR